MGTFDGSMIKICWAKVSNPNESIAKAAPMEAKFLILRLSRPILAGKIYTDKTTNLNFVLHDNLKLPQEPGHAPPKISKSSNRLSCSDPLLGGDENQFHGLWLRVPPRVTESAARVTIETAATSVLSVTCVLPIVKAC
jgi:hypothetical protein